MTPLDLTGLVRPHLVEMTKREDNANAAEFRLQPLERGYGYTLGNSLRRMLLSSLRGAAVWAFRLDGVVHEHQTIPGVVEDVHQIIQRLKALTLVLAADVDEAVLHIKHDKRDEFKVKVQKGMCYRYFAVADDGIKDIDIIVLKKGALMAMDKTDHPIAVLMPDGR